MKIHLNKEQFVKQFLLPVSKISEECTINFTDKNVFTLINDSNKTTILFCKVDNVTGLKDTEATKLNVKDLGKLIRVIDCIATDEFDIEVDDNASTLKYTSKDMSFKLHLVTDNVIRKCTTSLDKVNKLTFSSEFLMSKDKLSEILKGSVFATDTKKIYFYTKDGSVFAELTDKTTQNIDSITFCITSSFTGDEIKEPLPFSLEFFRMVSALKTDTIKVKINPIYKLVIFEVECENSLLKYIIAAYTK